MGTIITRKRKDGSTAYNAQIVRKEGGKIVYREAETFDRRQAAKAWLARRETQLRAPGALDRKEDPLLRDVIDRYIKESEKQIGRTKAQVLRTVKDHDIAELRCSKVTTSDVISFLQSLAVTAATRQNYLSHLGAVFTVAQPMCAYPLDRAVIKDAFLVANKMGITGKSRKRDRRPTLDELDKLMAHFGGVKAKRRGSLPMQKVVVFALFSTRRQEEITRITWADYDKTRLMIRDMKHPGEKVGNDTWCDLPPEATAVIESLPRGKDEDCIFPYTTDAICAAFTRACYFLKISTPEMPAEKRLHFHDLRHEGVSRLFEMGKTIPQVASVSGHRSWQSLQRYTHLRQVGDKYENWKWKNVETVEAAAR